ncbi:hypothetical protein FOZ62_024367 [Perkinsus olseni]|uniref:Uncharacterized protein n=1 Tax=Perkinsus olseni TaxID=32597 RepID=A0A7J6TP53_PEROL|nr:hypothetical protein FOZ62_024367 [Perkinsus olseni]
MAARLGPFTLSDSVGNKLRKPHKRSRPESALVDSGSAITYIFEEEFNAVMDVTWKGMKKAKTDLKIKKKKLECKGTESDGIAEAQMIRREAICGLLGVIDFTLLRFLPDAETDKYCGRFVEKELVTLEETSIFRSYLVWLKSTGEQTSLCTSYFGGVSLAIGNDLPSDGQPVELSALDRALQFSYARDKERECRSHSVCDGLNDGLAFASGEDHAATGDVTTSVLCIFNDLQGSDYCQDDSEILNDRQDGCEIPSGYHDGCDCLVLPDHLMDVEDTMCSAHDEDGVGIEKLVIIVTMHCVYWRSF